MRRLFPLVLLLALTTSANAQYTFTTIDVPGATWTSLLAINDKGDMAGSYRQGARNYAFTVAKDGTINVVDASTSPSPNSTWGLNDVGDMVGNTNPGSAPHHPAYLIHKGILTPLAFPGADDTLANAINNPGTVVGQWFLRAGDGTVLAVHGYVWKDDVFSEYLYPGAADTWIGGINARGDIVGTWDTDFNLPVSHGFVCSSGSCTSFDVPFAGGFLTGAQSINAEGQITGAYYDENFDVHGFLLIGGEFQKFDAPGSIQTYPYGINAAGQIVGWYANSDYVMHGFVAEPGNKSKPPKP